QRPDLSVFPGGTGNDFHWLLYGAMKLEEQVGHVLEVAPRPVDLGVCNDRFFLNGMGIGFEGEVAKALTGRKKRPGQASFLSTVIRKIFSYRSRTYDIHADEYKSSGKKLLIDICNGRRAGGGFHVAPVAIPDDGFLNVVIADPLTSLQRLLYLPVIEKGKHLERPFVRHFLTKKVLVESNTPISYHLDGEYHSAPQLLVEIMSGALSFRY
ncbi:MAG: diacylglycerol/lipid kinase family protein, partial [Chitinophagaceae bacterium]